MTTPTRQLGSSGLHVSALGLGCMGMSQSYGTTDDAASVRTLNHAVEIGVTFWDTADVYGPHTNEELLGPVVRQHRDQVVLATKFGLASPPDADGRRRFPRGDAAYVAEACDASLARLGIDHIDLYYLHRADPLIPIEETVGAMAELVRGGKVRYLGLSEVAADTLRRAVAVHPIAALQSEWSLWTREVEDEVLPAARELGVGIVPFSPLGRGFFTGSLTSPEQFPEGDLRRGMDRYQGEAFEANRVLLAPLFELATELGCTPAQLALAWVLAQGEDVVPIPGTKRAERLDENAAALNLTLSAEQLARLAGIGSGGVAGTRHPHGRPLSSGSTPPAT